MPAFCARWPDGSFSIVDADDETHALIQLDELGDEPAQLWQLRSCLLDFELTDSGTFRIREFRRGDWIRDYGESLSSAQQNTGGRSVCRSRDGRPN